ncbi:MAG: N-acetyltransferase [Kiritimatiellae bacterium]|nr:N-acetyltransferase [Kiritimatiellia bacterium]
MSANNKSFIHPTAIVETDVVGRNTTIWAFAHVMAGASVGCDCNIGDHVFIETGAVLGDGVTVKNNALIWKGVTIGNYTFIGPNVVFTNDRCPRSPRMPRIQALRRKESDWLVPTRVGEGASIGANATILAGVTIGRYAMIGAGSVITRDVPDFALAVGNPARVVGKVDELGRRVEGDPTEDIT